MSLFVRVPAVVTAGVEPMDGRDDDLHQDISLTENDRDKEEPVVVRQTLRLSSRSVIVGIACGFGRSVFPK